MCGESSHGNNKCGGNQKCNSKDHIQHLCFLLSEGFDEKNPAEFDDIVKDPRFQCHTCGRTAHSAENVCMPIEL